MIKCHLDLIELEKKAIPISPFHGRSKTIYDSSLGWITIKGGGWTWSKKFYLISKKDKHLVFGLYGEKDAKREIKVSNYLLESKIRAGKVIGWTRLDHFTVNSNRIDISDICFSDGSKVYPSLIAYHHIIPVRTADLSFMSHQERTKWIDLTCKSMNWSFESYLTNFSRTLGMELARLHQLGGTNDTLTWDNITLAAEWTDFEWFYVPGIPLPDGTTCEMIEERQWKSCIDAFEVVDKLAALIEPNSRSKAIMDCLEGYEAANGPINIRKDWCEY